MAELLCRVENCTYNQDCLCCKGDISVGASMLAERMRPVVKASGKKEVP